MTTSIQRDGVRDRHRAHAEAVDLVRLAADQPPAMASLLELTPQLRSLWESGAVTELMQDQILAIAEQPEEVCDDLRYGWVTLARERDVTLRVVESLQPERLYGTCRDQLILSLGDQTWEVYRHNTAHQVGVFDSDAKIQLHGKQEKTAGEITPVRTWVDVVSISGAPSLVLSGNLGDTIEWSYERDGTPAEAILAVPYWGHIETALRVLAQTGANDAGPMLESLLNHPAHNIRWEALRTMETVAPERLHAAVRRLREDPHPEVRHGASLVWEEICRQ